MAAVDDIYNQITRNSRTRRGRSFFPAANSTPQGQIIQRSGAGNAGYGIGNGALPPDQNPAYQAAIAKGRPDRSGYTTITLPSGGTASVPIASAQRYLNTFPERPAIAAANGAPAVGATVAAAPFDPNRAQDITHLQNQLNFPRLYGQGYGNIPAVSKPPTQFERIQRGQSGVGEIASFAAHNLLGVPQNQNLLAGLGRNWFGGAGGQQAAQYGSNQSTGQLPSQPIAQQPSVQSQNFYNYNPSPVPMKRYSDAPSYRDLGYY